MPGLITPLCWWSVIAPLVWSDHCITCMIWQLHLLCMVWSLHRLYSLTTAPHLWSHRCTTCMAWPLHHFYGLTTAPYVWSDQCTTYIAWPPHHLYCLTIVSLEPFLNSPSFNWSPIAFKGILTSTDVNRILKEKFTKRTVFVYLTGFDHYHRWTEHWRNANSKNTNKAAKGFFGEYHLHWCRKQSKSEWAKIHGLVA